MIAVKAKFDGKKIVLPEGFEAPAAGEVVVVFGAADWDTKDPSYLSLLNGTLAKAWDNFADAIYDKL